MKKQMWMTPDRRADSGDTLAFTFIPDPCPHSGLSTFQISAFQVRMHSCPHGKCSRGLHKARPIKINWGSLLSHQVQLLCSHVFIYSFPAEKWKKGVLCRASASQRNTGLQFCVLGGRQRNKYIWYEKHETASFCKNQLGALFCTDQWEASFYERK